MEVWRFRLDLTYEKTGSRKSRGKKAQLWSEPLNGGEWSGRVLVGEKEFGKPLRGMKKRFPGRRGREKRTLMLGAEEYIRRKAGERREARRVCADTVWTNPRLLLIWRLGLVSKFLGVNVDREMGREEEERTFVLLWEKIGGRLTGFPRQRVPNHKGAALLMGVGNCFPSL